MNWRHLQTFLWLRWRLLRNQWRRGGTVNAVLMLIITVGAVVTAIPLFLSALGLGLFLIPKAQPVHLLYAWDALIVPFLFFWSIGLITELQRSEPLALSKFLHLPVSVNGAFVINYVSSLLRLTLIVFVPLMLGFAVALVATKGIALLPVLPLLAAFLLMITALTYQFQGWLGGLMSNPRRRRTVIVTVTTLFVLIFQLPNLFNLYAPWGVQERNAQSSKLMKELAEVQRDWQARQLQAQERLRRHQERFEQLRREAQSGAQASAELAEENASYQREIQAQEAETKDFLRHQQEAMERHKLAVQQMNRESAAGLARTARIANMILPVGWLPLGTMTAAEGRLAPTVLALLGMAFIGIASLWRAYRGSVRQYQGQATARGVRPQAKPAEPAGAPQSGALPLGTRLPGLSEPASAVALGALRSLMRAPEAKMMLLTPAIMVLVFGSMMVKQRHEIPQAVRPMVAIGAMVFVLFGVLQLMANQFGFDRDGFRVFVLCPAPRRDILLGKNVAFGTITLALAALLLLILQALCPMRADHFVAMVPQFLSMYLVFCMLVNAVSIYTPVYLAAGSLKPASPKLSTVLLQLLMFLVLFPLTQGATLLPLGAEAVLQALGWDAGVPIYLLLALVECAGIVALYHVSLRWTGELLQTREQKILDVVTKPAS